MEYITSIGMAILVELVAQAYQANHCLAAYGLSDHNFHFRKSVQRAIFLGVVMSLWHTTDNENYQLTAIC